MVNPNSPWFNPIVPEPIIEQEIPEGYRYTVHDEADKDMFLRLKEDVISGQVLGVEHISMLYSILFKPEVDEVLVDIDTPKGYIRWWPLNKDHFREYLIKE